MAMPHRIDRFIEHGGADIPKELNEGLSAVFGELPFVYNDDETDEDGKFPEFGLDEEIFPGSHAGGMPIFVYLKKKHPALSF